MFTIEVKKREAGEEFSFEDIHKEARVFHDECYRGKTSWVEHSSAHWHFDCQRCRANVVIEGVDDMERASLLITQTVIDGKERKIGDGVRVVQRKS